MTRNDVLKIILETYSVSPEYPWEGETHAVLRHPGSNKWFAIIMDVKKKHLHLSDADFDGEKFEDIMNVKANPVLIEELLHEDTFLPAWHMNKTHWCTVDVNKLATDVLDAIIKTSFDVTATVKKK